MLGLILLFISILTAADPVVHRMPAASSVFPQGARPGDTVEAEVLGEYLDRAIRVDFADSSITGSIEEVVATRLKLKLRVAPSAFYGVHSFRIITPRGSSGPLLFRIGDQPRVRETEPNSTIEQAMKVPTPVTIDARLNTEGDFDFFRFSAKAGESWIFDLRAARNGNGLDAGLILMTTEGRKLAHSEDYFIWDPFFEYTFRESGDYILAVQPTSRNNDPNFAYELDIRQTPQLQTMAPLSIPPGASTEATVHGIGLRGDGARLEFDDAQMSGKVLEMRGATARVMIQAPAGAAPGEHQMVIVNSGGRSNAVRFLIDGTPLFHDGQLKPPVSISSIMRYRDPEKFTLQAKEGETLVFEVRAGRFGSPADSMLRILDAKGKQVATNDDFQFTVADFYNKDSRLMYKFKEAGEYTVVLRNMVAATGENYPYQLRVTRPEPYYDLELGVDRLYVYPGKEAKLKIAVKRFDGHKAAIPIQVLGLPEGVTADAGEIAEGKTDVELKLHAADNVAAGTFGQLEIKAEGHTAWRPVRVASGGGEGATFTKANRTTLTVAEKPSFSLEAVATNVTVTKGGSVMIPLMIRREAEFTGAIDFRLENLPAGVTLEKASAIAGQDRIDLKITAANDATRARGARVSIVGKSGTEEQMAPRISIQVE